MESSFNDREYRRYKNLVKQWECKFKKKEKRNPTKEDIKAASSEVKEAYKMYWILKTAALEEAILDDEIDDTPKHNKSTEESKENSQTISPQIDKPPEEVKQGPSKAPESTVNAMVWGDHLNKPSPKLDKTKIKRSTSFQFAEKLYQNTKFKKIRNPRKSFIPLNRSKSSEVLPQSEDSQDTSQAETNEQEQINDDVSIDFGENIRITTGNLTTTAQPVNMLQKLDNFNEIQTKSKLNSGWLERCNQTCDFISNSPVQSDNHLSDDDYVFSSDDESSRKLWSLTPKVIPRDMPKDNVSKESFTMSPVQPRVTSNEPENVPSPVPEEPATSHNVPSEVTELLDAIPNSKCIMAVELPRTKRTATEQLPRPKKKTKIGDSEESRKEKILREKVASGKANENFVSLNMKKKIFVRGKKTMTGTKYKKQQWKMKKKASNGYSGTNSDVSGVLKCFKCGDVGHFSRQCQKHNNLLPKDDLSDEEDSPFPTLEEAADMVKEKRVNKTKTISTESIEESFCPEPEEETSKTVPPLYEFKKDCVIDTPLEVHEALSEFGYTNFRTGQEDAIMRILYGKSTLFISSTGSGKSLCYQIPAYLYAKKYRCISLVISPLVSLMEDQVVNFPKVLGAACLHTNQSDKQRAEIIEKIKQNEIAVLLVSPEAMVSSNSPLNKAILKDFPPIAFACIDEVHCVSQWSHNFRTSYLLICKILRERFNVHTLLGLTATATKSTVACIKDHLGIDDEEEGVIQDKILPENLILSVSRDENRDLALIELLESQPFCEYKSIIIYCIRRNECERLAARLRTVLKDVRTLEANIKTRKTLSPDVEEYHAGLSAARRKRVQNAFMSGKLRIVVATVAFGMGINKSDIRGIIHYNMPGTYEHYVQEIGRAGRDGLEARCHLFLDCEGNDLPELRRHIYANSVDRKDIRELLQNIFTTCNCEETCGKHEVAFSVENTVRALDLNQESITTLLCYLELLPEKIVQVLPPTYVTCTIQSYGGNKALKKVAKKCPPLAYVIAEHRKNTNSEISSKLEFSVIELADKIGWRSGTVKNELKRSEWTQENDRPKKSGLIVNFSDLGFHVLSSGNLTAEQMDDALDMLSSTVQSQEKKALYQLETCHETFNLYSFKNVRECLQSDEVVTRNQSLKNLMRTYFSEDSEIQDFRLPEVDTSNGRVIACDVHRLVNSYKDCTFTGRSIARIFHGIESPNFPAVIWSRSPFWRCGLREDFNFLCLIASRELIKLK